MIDTEKETERQEKHKGTERMFGVLYVLSSFNFPLFLLQRENDIGSDLKAQIHNKILQSVRL